MVAPAPWHRKPRRFEGGRERQREKGKETASALPFRPSPAAFTGLWSWGRLLQYSPHIDSLPIMNSSVRSWWSSFLFLRIFSTVNFMCHYLWSDFSVRIFYPKSPYSCWCWIWILFRAIFTCWMDDWIYYTYPGNRDRLGCCIGRSWICWDITFMSNTEREFLLYSNLAHSNTSPILLLFPYFTCSILYFQLKGFLVDGNVMISHLFKLMF